MWSTCATAALPPGSDAVAAPDDLEHDLVGAGPDPVEADVAVGALDLVLLHVAVAAVDLDALVGDLAGDPRGVELCLRDLTHRVLAVGVAPGGRVGELPGGLDLGRHLGELVADHLEVADRAAEGLALLRVVQGALEHALGARHRAGASDHPLALELPGDVVEALALLAEQVRDRHADVLEA